MERAAEILVVSLTMNPARDKDTNAPALGVSNRRGQPSASFPGTQQLSLAPGGFLATKDTWHRLRVQGWSLLQHQLAPPRGGCLLPQLTPRCVELPDALHGSDWAQGDVLAKGHLLCPILTSPRGDCIPGPGTEPVPSRASAGLAPQQIRATRYVLTHITV